jgi:hypothetical protein
MVGRSRVDVDGRWASQREDKAAASVEVFSVTFTCNTRGRALKVSASRKRDESRQQRKKKTWHHNVSLHVRFKGINKGLKVWYVLSGMDRDQGELRFPSKQVLRSRREGGIEERKETLSYSIQQAHAFIRRWLRPDL